MLPARGNIFGDLPSHAPEEFFETVLQAAGFRMERIVSMGHATPAGEWYDQEADEWVLLVRGSAGLRIEGEEEILTLRPGDHLLLPARMRHRVEWTDSATATVWLALHFVGPQD
jgi:cupin 2 domain-containing protein